MRVAYVCLDPGVPVFGCKGSSVHCQEVMREFLRRGYDVDLFARRLGNDIPDDLSEISVHQLGGKLDKKDRALREKSMVNLNPLVYQCLQDVGPFDLVYERYSLWNCAAMQYASDNEIPGILEANSPLIHEQKTYRVLVDEAAAKSIRAKCFKRATSIVAVSEQVADRLRTNYYAADKTNAIANGVNCEKFANLGGQSKRITNSITVGFVGTLKPWHGVATLLDAFAIAHEQNPLINLKIIGDGPEKEKLQSRLERFSSSVRESVEWTGSLPNAQVPQVMSTFDIAVAPYPDLQDFYFSPLKILEYMAAGLPIIASDIGQIPSLIQHKQTGLLVQSGSEMRLADSIVELSHDREMRLQLGAAARRRAESKHTWEFVVDRILDTVPFKPAQCEVR